MNIAIIGAGNMGGALAKRFAGAGFGVAIADNGSGKAEAAARDAGASAHAARAMDAVANADIVVFAAPFGAAREALAPLAHALAGKIVIDITNPISADYMSLTIGHSTSAAEEVQKLVPAARVVKAFNTVLAQVLSEGPDFGGQRVQVFVAGDDATAKETVKGVVAKLGFEPVDAGGLANARYLEPIAEQNIHFAYALGQGVQIAPAWIKRAA
jgi:hypothetical protein